MAAYNVATQLLAATGSTGTPTSGSVVLPPEADAIAVQFVVEAIGATPTITYKAQVSLDGTNWIDLPYITPASATEAQTAITRTTVGVDPVFIAQPLVRDWRFIRSVVTANTNVTFRIEMYLTSALA